MSLSTTAHPYVGADFPERARSAVPQEAPDKPEITMNLPPFLQSLVAGIEAKGGKPLPLPLKGATEDRCKAKECDGRGTQQTPLTQSTSATATADSSDKATEAIVTATPQKHWALVTPKLSPPLLVAKAAKRSGRSKGHEAPVTSNVEEDLKESEASDICNTWANEFPIARLATALAASGLRLAAAAEEGLESSPSQSEGCSLTAVRGRAPRASKASTVDPSKNADYTVQTRSWGWACRLEDNSAAADVLRPSACIVSPGASPVKPSRGASQQKVSRVISRGERPRQYSDQQAAADAGCSASSAPGFAQGKKMRQTKSGSYTVSAFDTGPSKVRKKTAPLFREKMQCCCRGSRRSEASSTSSEYSGVTEEPREDNANPLEETILHAHAELTAASKYPPPYEHFHGRSHSKQGTIFASPLHQNQADTGEQSCVGGGSTVPEEQQFCALLHHSMGLLRREASRCFASTQALAKQKLWGELQRERLLRLQQLQEHQTAAATAEAKLSSLLARRASENSRAARLLEICCNRNAADHGFCLVVRAWRAWLHHRLLARRYKQVERLSQQRRRLLLLMRSFLPWHAAAARCRAVRYQMGTQRLLQQEMSRLEQAHIEGRKEQQQQLLKLHEQLAEEVRLRECLQQSLIGIVAGGAVVNSLSGEGQAKSSAGHPSTIAPCTAALKRKTQNEKHQPRPQHLKRHSPLTVIGSHSAPKSRDAPLRQHKQQKQPSTQLQTQKQFCRHFSMHRREAAAFQMPVNRAGVTEPAHIIEKVGFTWRQADLVSEELHAARQRSQRLLLLASLLASCQSLKDVSGDKEILKSSGDVPLACLLSEVSLPGLSSNASVPAIAGGAFVGKALAPALAAAQNIQAERPSALLFPHPCLQPEAASDKSNGIQHCAVGLTSGLLDGGRGSKDKQPHKGSRWRAAAHSTSLV
ncbi:hypothetical protein Efla_001327 [Eimeria flavescens]